MVCIKEYSILLERNNCPINIKENDNKKTIAALKSQNFNPMLLPSSELRSFVESY